MLNGPASDLVPIGRGVGPMHAGVRTLALLGCRAVSSARSRTVSPTTTTPASRSAGTRSSLGAAAASRHSAGRWAVGPGRWARNGGTYSAAMSPASRLRVGVQLPEVERRVPWSEYVAMARAAEEVGFDSIWVGDHLLYRDDGREEGGPWEAWSVLSALAAVTERVRLGPLVACCGFCRSGLLARKAAAIQEISGGRLVLGLGAGWNESEFRAFGVPFDHTPPALSSPSRSFAGCWPVSG